MNGRCSCIEWHVIPLANEIAITVVDSVANELASGSQTNKCNQTEVKHDKRQDIMN